MTNKKTNIQFNPISLLPLIILIVCFPDYRTILGILAVAVHELGHIMAILICGCGIKSVCLAPAGIEITIKRSACRPRHKIMISSFGCIFNLISSIIAIFLGYVFKEIKIYTDCYFFSSAVLCCFNALPVCGLDGGETLEIILDKYLLPDQTYALTRFISFVFIFIMWVFACYILFQTNANLSLFCVCLMLFCSNFRE